MLNYTCPRGGQVILAETRQALAAKLRLHRHNARHLQHACIPRQAPAPIQRAYRNTTAVGVTRGGY